MSGPPDGLQLRSIHRSAYLFDAGRLFFYHDDGAVAQDGFTRSYKRKILPALDVQLDEIDGIELEAVQGSAFNRYDLVSLKTIERGDDLRMVADE